MAHIEGNESAARIRAHAFNSLTPERRQRTNLYLDQRIYEKGETLGPAFQKLVVPKRSVLVFADDDPLANYGHDCRYLLYDPETGKPHAELPARFPPYTTRKPETLTAFHEPMRLDPNPALFWVRPILRCPIIFPDGNRYAILYSGMSNMRHLNDLEFCYRMLVDRYGFDPKHIYVLNYDGALNTQDGAASHWPGDGSAYRIKVTGQGTRAGFEAAINDLRTKIGGHDLLFIHTNNHGDNDGSQSFLCEYPSWASYYANDFCAALHTLPRYRSLTVMMEQCNSGGFNTPVIAASTADNTVIASAAIASQSSYASPDGHWDSFARDWIAAQIGHDPYGAALAFNPDTNGNGAVESREAFAYANASTVRNPYDSPNYNESSSGAGDIALSQQYAFWWWWCWILWPLLEKYYEGPVPYPGPGPEFNERLIAVTPELQKVLLSHIDRMAVELRREVAPKVEAIIQGAFQRARK
jgi:hypothetical protein